MAVFAQKYLEPRRAEALQIFDVGSQDINGSYRPLFDRPPWRYTGVDMTAGKNVDLVLRDPYHWGEVAAGSVDVIVSGQTFEHTEFFWLSLEEMARALKTGGLLCLIAPSAGDEHRYPVDCWRVYPDGLRAIALYAGLETLEAWTQWENLPQYTGESNMWHDSVLIARKRPPSGRKWRQLLRRWNGSRPKYASR
jgi:SAM-dependent methyltransferase